jgi:ribonuclease P protein component
MTPPSRSPLSKLPTEFSNAGPADAARLRDARLRKHAEYQRVYKATRKQFSASMSWFLAPREPSSTTPVQTSSTTTGPRVGLTAGKVLGKAHERNRIKRRMREVVRKHIQTLPDGVDLILHPKRSVMTMDFGKLEAEVLRIFHQAAAQMRETGKTQDRSVGRLNV